LEITGISVAAITIVAYLIGEGVKLSPLDNRWIPLICGLCGGALGIAGMYLMADFPAGDLLSALAVGIASGLAATGLDQSVKQLSRNGESG